MINDTMGCDASRCDAMGCDGDDDELADAGDIHVAKGSRHVG
jgi:hypothetical protein